MFGYENQLRLRNKSFDSSTEHRNVEQPYNYYYYIAGLKQSLVKTKSFQTTEIQGTI